MTWKGCHPIINLVKKTYNTGISLTKKAMQNIEAQISRIKGIEKWAVDIPCYME
jgi:hypothetical protein